MAKKSHEGEEPVGWVTVKGKHFPKWADGTIGWENGEEHIDTKTNKDTKKSPWNEVNDYRDRLSKAKSQKEKDKIMDEMDEAWKRYDHDKSLSDVEKNQLQSHMHDTWTGKYKKTARDTANEVLRIRDSLDNSGKAVTSNKEVADMYKQNANSNFDFKVQGKNGEYHITATKKATMELGNGLRLTADVSNPNKNISEVERAKKVNREKQYADKKLNQYRKTAKEEKEKAQSIADAISANTGIANTGSRNARYDTSRANVDYVKKPIASLKNIYKSASPEEQKKIAAELNTRGIYRKNGKWVSYGGGR